MIVERQILLNGIVVHSQRVKVGSNQRERCRGEQFQEAVNNSLEIMVLWHVLEVGIVQFESLKFLGQFSWRLFS